MSITLPVMIRRVQGHSMVPVLPPGTLVVGWRWFKKLKSQQIVVFTRGAREMIKRIDHIEDKGVYVLGDHPETSTDSRNFGAIPRASISSVVLWPHAPKVEAIIPVKPAPSKKKTTRPRDI